MVATAGHRGECAGNPAILLVTTDENLKTSLQKALLGLNYELLTARNGGTAFELAAARKPAIVLVDRDKHSWQALRHHQSLKHIPMRRFKRLIMRVKKKIVSASWMRDSMPVGATRVAVRSSRTFVPFFAGI